MSVTSLVPDAVEGWVRSAALPTLCVSASASSPLESELLLSLRFTLPPTCLTSTIGTVSGVCMCVCSECAACGV